MRLSRSGLLFLGLFILGCSEDIESPPRGPDRVVVTDSGQMQDAQALEPDGTTLVNPDAMIEEDAGFTADAADLADTGVGGDVGESSDAGQMIDSGTRLCGCSANEYCESQTANSCMAPGTCRPRPGACAEIYSPVCGCDKKNYSNECQANSAGVDISHDGDCDCRDLGCGTDQWCQPCRTTMGVSYVCLPRGAVC